MSSAQTTCQTYTKHLLAGQVGALAGLASLPRLNTLGERLRIIADTGDALGLHRLWSPPMLAADATMAAAVPALDIAILTPATLPSIVVPAVLGRADQLSVGDDVVAIGNPLGLTRTTTAGVVSGLNRIAPGPDGVRLSGLIQFDAAVNPGSSGGPLLNARGETVGIVVALANPTAAGTFIGIGFAVPIAIAVAAGGDRGPQQ